MAVECGPAGGLRPALLRGDRRQWVTFLAGAVVLSFGVAATITAGLGVGSWQVFETGLVATTGAPFGVIAVIESLLVLAVAWVWLWQVPGPATIVFAVAVGPLIGALLEVLPQPALWPAAALQFLVGVTATAIGIGFYIGADLGASAQDSLFVGLFRRYRLGVGTARFTTDASLVGLGWALGGQVGLGTIAVTIGLPVLVPPALRLGQRLAGTARTG